MSTPSRFELRIDKIIAGGDGLGKHQGQVVFVPQAAPGDRLLVERTLTRRDYVRARIIEVLDPSSERRPAPCRFYPQCGGCSLMHLQPVAQVEAKRRILTESLRRAGHVDFSGEIHVHSGPELEYRARARFHVHSSKRGHGPVVVGFKEHSSDRIVDVTHCLQISPQSNAVLNEIRRWLAEKPARARGLMSFEALETADSVSSKVSVAGEKLLETGRILLHFVVKKDKSPPRRDLEDLARRACLLGLVVTEEDERKKDRRYRLGYSKILHRVHDNEYQTQIGSFFQINRYLLDTLVNEVTLKTNLEGALVVDLYCGVGLFTLPMARLAARVVGVESSSVAIMDAKANRRKAGLDNVDFVESAAGAYAANIGFEGVDTVVADPPRGGLEPPVVEALLKDLPRELRYVSCDPAALGRDAGRLARGGLGLERLALLDWFPNTHHFETVATFRPRIAALVCR